MTSLIVENAKADSENQEKASPQHSIPITGRLGVFDSSFWKGALAIIGARYLPLPFFRDSIKEGKNFYKKQIYSVISGGIMEGVTVFFAYRTWKDMRSIFSQALAWEFNKDPKDISFSDFRNSKNTMVQQTVNNYTKYNFRRSLINATFFLPLIGGAGIKKFASPKNVGSAWHPDNWHGEAGANLGVGANSLYLFTDVMSRQQTPFELLQATIDRKINHAEHFGDKMTSNDLLDIYEQHAANGTTKSFIPQRGTLEWERSLTLFTRMAELINETYKNTPSKEYADFGIDDFIYMVGNNLIDPSNVDRSRAYIEIANRYDVPALKDAAQIINNGGSLDEISKKYPVTLPKDPMAERVPAEKKFTDTISPNPLSLTEQVIAKRQKTDSDPQLNL